MRILIIAEYMAPAQAIASIRWTKLGKYLAKDHGCQVDILTNKKIYEEKASGSELYKRDDTLQEDARYFDRVYEIPGTLLSRAVICALNTVKLARARGSRRKGVGALEAPKEEKAVLGDSSSAARLGDSYIRLKEDGYLASFRKAHVPWADYDVIISTYGPKWTHLIAEEVRRENPHLVWIADYRDIVIDVASDINSINKTFAQSHTAMADCVFTVARDGVGQLYLPLGQRVEVVYNGFDPEERKARERKRDGRFILAYTGTLYNDPPNVRDITPVLKALSELITKGRIDREDVLVSYCGPSEGEFQSQASQYPDVPTEVLGLVSRQEAQELQDRASLLIFATWNTENSRGALSGKLYEYMSSGVPVVSVCAGNVPDAEPSEVIRRSRIGFAYDEIEGNAHYPLLVDFIQEKYEEWQLSGMTTLDANTDFIKSFEHRSVAERVYGIITELHAGAKQDALDEDPSSL